MASPPPPYSMAAGPHRPPERANYGRADSYRGVMAQGPHSELERRRSRYSEAEIELGLRSLAIVSGNARKASALLRRQDVEIPRTTLQLWASDLYAERYAQIKRELMPAIYDRIAERSENVVEDLADLEDQLVDQLRRQAPELAPRDTAGALRNVAVSKAVNIDKASVIRGRPTEITAHADVTDILKSLKRDYGNVVKVAPELATELVGRSSHRAPSNRLSPSGDTARAMSEEPSISS